MYWGIPASMWGTTGAPIYPPPRPGLANGDKRLISQELADEVALIAQKYTGYFYGHPTRAAQYQTPEAGKVFVEYGKKWDEPLVFPDNCEFCEKTLSDERVIARVDGFQAAIDHEVEHGRGRESFPLNELPLYLKRRMCIEWNHAFKRFLEAKPFLFYDFETREVKEKVAAQPEPVKLEVPGGIYNPHA